MFEDELRVRPLLCKHLPSVLARFELCLGLIYEVLDVCSETVTYIWRSFGGDLARYSFLICEGLDVLYEPAERMRHPFSDDLARHFGVSCDGRRVFLRANRAAEVIVFCLDEECRSPTLG